MTANIVEIKANPDKDVPTGVDAKTVNESHGEPMTGNIDPRQIYKNLCEQEQRGIEAIRGLRHIKNELRKDFDTEPKAKQMTRNQFLRHVHKDLAQNFMTVLRSMNVTAIPHHVVNPIAVRHDGLSGDGTRQITEFLYFPDHASETPIAAENFDTIPDDSVLFAEEAIGYTTVKLEFDANGERVTIIGKTICSAHDDYNGNLGVVLALKNAFEQIEARNIDTPLIALGHLIAGFQDMAAIQLLG